MCMAFHLKKRGLLFFYSLGPSQQFFRQVWTGLPGLNQYLAVDKVSCSRKQKSDSAGGET